MELHPLLQKKKDSLADSIVQSEERSEDLAIIESSKIKNIATALDSQVYSDDPLIATIEKERTEIIKEMQLKRHEASYQQLALTLSQLNKDIELLKNPKSSQDSQKSNIVAININLPDGTSQRVVASINQSPSEVIDIEDNDN